MEDREFLKAYRDTFVENFLSSMEESIPGVLNSQAIRVLVRKLYSVIFSFKENMEKEIFELFYSLARNGVNIKKPLTESLLTLLRDYVDHVAKEGGDYRKVKEMVDLIDRVLISVDSAYSKYLRELREKASPKEETQAIELEKALKVVKEAEGGEVDLLTYYKEVPATCRTKLLKVEGKEITVGMCDLKIFDIGSVLYLRLRDLPGAVQVRVKEVDHSERAVKLEVLGLSDLPQERRRFVRVVPKEPVPVKLERNGWTVTGSMADVSVGGVGVYVEDPDDLKENDPVKVSFELPKGKVETLGVVRYVIERGGVFRVGIQYELDLKQEDVVSDYVMERQFEILRELRGPSV